MSFAESHHRDTPLVLPNAWDVSSALALAAAIEQRLPGVFVTARVDTYRFGQHATVVETVARATAYAEAGADGMFVPGATAAVAHAKTP